MKITIRTATEYTGKKGESRESFDIEVESGQGNRPEDVAKTYLVVRKIIKDGIKNGEEA